MAAYYQLETARGGMNRAEARIVSARIADDSGQFDVRLTADAIANRTAEARLLSNVLREIVEHYAPLGIKVFVLAFQIIGHVWGEATRRTIARSAWVARTIDQLSRLHDVVFVTITGNISPTDIADLLGEADYPEYLIRPLAKLHDPGQAALAITVGSVAHTATIAVAPMLPIALESQPSPFTRSGPGFGDSIKPDVIERGGNLVRDPQSGAVSSNLATDILMASNALTPPMQRAHGTSFAAPRVAHRLALIARDLRAIGANATNPLLRALLVASADRPADSEMLDPQGNCELIGHGLPDATRLTDRSGNSVLLYWNGELPADSTALFNLYLPAELRSAGRGRKRIVVCVASQPTVQQWGVEEYVGVSMKFRLFRGDENIDQIQAILQRESWRTKRCCRRRNTSRGPRLCSWSVPTIIRVRSSAIVLSGSTTKPNTAKMTMSSPFHLSRLRGCPINSFLLRLWFALKIQQPNIRNFMLRFVQECRHRFECERVELVCGMRGLLLVFALFALATSSFGA